MRIVFATDSFKGSARAAEVGAALAVGWHEIDPAVVAVPAPMADGGEGTLEAFVASDSAAVWREATVTGPEDIQITVPWLELSDGTAVVELGTTSGIELMAGGLRPMQAHTLGFGQAIGAALDAGATRLVLGIGSSASTDGGAGVLIALGARVLDADGNDLGPSPAELARAVSIDLSGLRPLPVGGVSVLSDVVSPLHGATGAAAVFGPQKGASPEQVVELQSTLHRWASLLGGMPDAQGAGAAGGTGFALQFWGGTIISGASGVAERSGLVDAIANADLVITGEGSFDASTAAGKVPAIVAQLAEHEGVPVALVAGRIAADADTSRFVATVSLTELAGSGDAALADPQRWLTEAARVLARQRARPRDQAS